MCKTLLIAFTLAATTQAAETQLISWNIESGGADAGVIARELSELPKVDAYLLQEVNGKDIGRLAAAVRKAHGNEFRFYLSSLGGGDRLAIIVDESKYRIRSFSELISYADYRLNDFRHRSPLVAHLERRFDGQGFLLVNVHLARGNEKLRTEQAAGLRKWAKTQSLPVILAGDCNFDFNFATLKGNDAHVAFFEGGDFEEAKCEQRIDTNWADRNGDGIDDYPDSSLDFAAICRNGIQASATSKVIVRDGDFPDTDRTSDHRPVFVSIELREAVLSPQ